MSTSDRTGRRSSDGTRTHITATAGRKGRGSHGDTSKAARQNSVCRHERLHQGGAVPVVTPVVQNTGRGGTHSRLRLLLRGAADPGGIAVHENIVLLPVVGAGSGTAIVLLLVVVVVVVGVVVGHVTVGPKRGHGVRVVAGVVASNACDVPRPGMSPLHHRGLLLERLRAVVLLGHHVSGVVQRSKAGPPAHAAAPLHVLVQMRLLLLLRVVTHVMNRLRVRKTEVGDGRKLRQCYCGIRKATNHLQQKKE